VVQRQFRVSASSFELIMGEHLEGEHLEAVG